MRHNNILYCLRMFQSQVDLPFCSFFSAFCFLRLGELQMKNTTFWWEVVSVCCLEKNFLEWLGGISEHGQLLAMPYPELSFAQVIFNLLSGRELQNTREKKSLRCFVNVLERVTRTGKQSKLFSSRQIWRIGRKDRKKKIFENIRCYVLCKVKYFFFENRCG